MIWYLICGPKYLYHFATWKILFTCNYMVGGSMAFVIFNVIKCRKKLEYVVEIGDAFFWKGISMLRKIAWNILS